jgi:hypothetical protein
LLSVRLVPLFGTAFQFHVGTVPPGGQPNKESKQSEFA